LRPAMISAGVRTGEGFPSRRQSRRRFPAVSRPSPGAPRLTQLEFAKPARRPGRDHQKLGAGQNACPRGPGGGRLLAVIAHAPRDGVCRALAQPIVRHKFIRGQSPRSPWLAGAIVRGHNAPDPSGYPRCNLLRPTAQKSPAIGLGTWELRGRTCAPPGRAGHQARLPPCRPPRKSMRTKREVGEGPCARRGVKRDDVFVTTKVLDHPFRPPMTWNGPPRRA